jgi:hypothetical protein
MNPSLPESGPEFPAAFTVHWANGPVQCCVKHAQALIRLGNMLGAHVPATAAEPGGECINCKNEAALDRATATGSN